MKTEESKAVRNTQKERGREGEDYKRGSTYTVFYTGIEQH